MALENPWCQPDRPIEGLPQHVPSELIADVDRIANGESHLCQLRFSLSYCFSLGLGRFQHPPALLRLWPVAEVCCLDWVSQLQRALFHQPLDNIAKLL